MEGGRRRRPWLLAASLIPALLLFVGGPAFAQVADPPELVLTGSSSAGEAVGRGARFSYDLLVTNAGVDWASDVSVLARIPLGVRVINLLPTMEGGRCSVAGVGARLRFVVLCERPALGPGTTGTVGIDVEVMTAALCVPLVMRAAVSSGDTPALGPGTDSIAVRDETSCPAAVGLTVEGRRFAHVGDRVEVRYRVTNAGPVPLSDVSLSDPACDATPRRTDHPGAGDIAAGETWGYACTVEVVGADNLDRIVRVRARDPSGASVSDRVRTVVELLSPSIRIDVHPSPAIAAAGTWVVERFRVTNTGDSFLRAVTVLEGGRKIGVIRSLAPGATTVLRRARMLPQVDGRIVLNARVVARDRLGLEVSDRARAAVRIAPPTPADPDPGAGNDPGTAFTGSTDPAAGAFAMLVCAIIGVASLWVARPRSPSDR